ncbi:MAG TPA: DUF427 domain-containing protein [Candidatus Binatia bacterium]
MSDHAKPLETVPGVGSSVPEWPKSSASDHWIHIEESPRRVRVTFGGATIADSKRVLLLRESKCLPVYYFPSQDVRLDLMQPTTKRTQCPYKGDASYWTIVVGSKTAENAVWSYLDPPASAAAIRGCFAFQWTSMDAWREEEEEIFVHPRDPYKRVDALQSSRHVRIVVAGETVADTRRPRLLFETGHPSRYYIPLDDIRQDLLLRSETTSRCPYKGPASYWSVKIGDKIFPDLAWSYLDPIAECPKIKGLLCFFQEREATIHVDGEELPKLWTKWSR